MAIRIIRAVAFLAALLLSSAASAQWPGQCPTGTLTTTVGCQPEAGTPIVTDLVLGWQVNSALPHTRAVQIQQILSSNLPASFSTLNATGATTLGTTLSVAGVTTLSSNASVVGNLTVGGTVTVTGGVTFSGDLSVGGTLGVTGATTLSSTLGVTGATTLSNVLSVAGDVTFSSGKINLTNGVSNFILWPNAGIAAPTFTTRSAGTREVFSPTLSGSAVDYAIGINSSTLWLSVGNSAGVFRWYGGTTSAATLTGGGLFTAANGLVATAGGLIVNGGGAAINGGNLTVANNATVNGLLSSGGGLAVTGNATVTGTLGVGTGLIITGGGFLVVGNSSINGTLTIASGLTVTSGGETITAGGLTISAGGATVTGNSTITGTLGGLTGLTVASGGADITGNSNVTGTLGTTGDLLTQNISAVSLVTTGTVTAGSGLFAPAGGVSVVGNSGINGTLDVTIGLTVDAGGLTISAGGASIMGTVLVTGDLNPSGNMTVGGLLQVPGSSGGIPFGGGWQYDNVGGGALAPTTTAASIVAVSNILANNFLATSDRRLKSDVAPLTAQQGLAWVMASQPEEYTKGGRREWGFMAQDQIRSGYGRMVGSVLHHGLPASDEAGIHIEADTALALDRSDGVAPLVAAVQDIERRLEAIETNAAAMDHPRHARQ